MALLLYTTKIEPEQTISEIQKMLSGHGVTAMMTEYDGPHVSSVSFRMNVAGNPMAFRLPCNWRACREIFRKQGITSSQLKHKDKDLDAQAIRTAWRIIFEWVRAQLALVEVNMATVPQIFLPYAVMKDGRTLSEHVESNPGFLLGSGE
jgi:hypothetical protein